MLSRRSLSASFAQARSGNPCHLRLEQTPDGDQVVQQLHGGIMFKRDAQHRGIEQVPELARLNRRAAPLFHPHEPALFQELQPFPQNGPAETELVAQHRLRWKHRPLGQYTSDDPSRPAPRPRPWPAVRAVPIHATCRSVGYQARMESPQNSLETSYVKGATELLHSSAETRSLHGGTAFSAPASRHQPPGLCHSHNPRLARRGTPQPSQCPSPRPTGPPEFARGWPAT